MSWGVQIFDAIGRLTLDSTKQTWNYAGFFIAPANQTTTVTFQHTAGMTHISQQYLLNDIPTDQKVITHIVTANGNSVTAQGGNRSSIVTVLAR